MESMEQRFKLYMKYVEALYYHGKLLIIIIISIPLKLFIETDRKCENENLALIFENGAEVSLISIHY